MWTICVVGIMMIVRPVRPLYRLAARPIVATFNDLNLEFYVNVCFFCWNIVAHCSQIVTFFCCFICQTTGDAMTLSRNGFSIFFVSVSLVFVDCCVSTLDQQQNIKTRIFLNSGSTAMTQRPHLFPIVSERNNEATNRNMLRDNFLD